MHIAASSGNYQICSLLLRRNADVNATDESGNTALHAAAREKKWDIAELLLVKGASREKENAKGKTASSYGLDEALAEIQEEEERILKKQEWIAEERSNFQNEAARTLCSEREWREKLMDEHSFEYIEGSGCGSERRGHVGEHEAWVKDWFAEVDDGLNDEDWWASIARQMRQRHAAFTKNDGTRRDRAAQRPSAPAPDGGAFKGIGEDARLAWERKWAKEGQKPVPAARDGASGSGGPDAEARAAARAAAHALAWERFLTAQAAGGDAAGIRFEDVPWPCAPAGGDVAEEAMMLPAALRNDAEARRRAVREALRRWHPDKFGQRFGARLAAVDRDRILERVKAVSQALTALVQ